MTHVNGSAGVVEAPEPVDETEDRPVDEAVELLQATPEPAPEPITAPEAVEVPASPPAVAYPVDDPEAFEILASEPEPDGDDVTESDPPPDDDPALEDGPEPEDDPLDQPALIEDESPTMEHRVLVLDESEPEAIARESVREPEPVSEPEPHFRGRARIRRRARYLRRLRELQLRDIGGFALELHRFGRDRPDLLQAKIADAAQTDAELRALEQALNAEEPLRELREAGIGGVCSNCGAVHGSEDHFCATCGEPVGPNSEASRRSGEFDDLLGRG